MAILTEAEVDALEKLANAATPADRMAYWRYEHGLGRITVPDENRATRRDLIADFYDEANREFYYAARAGVPALIATLRAERAKVAGLEAKLNLFAECKALDKEQS